MHVCIHSTTSEPSICAKKALEEAEEGASGAGDNGWVPKGTCASPVSCPASFLPLSCSSLICERITAPDKWFSEYGRRSPASQSQRCLWKMQILNLASGSLNQVFPSKIHLKKKGCCWFWVSDKFDGHREKWYWMVYMPWWEMYKPRWTQRQADESRLVVLHSGTALSSRRKGQTRRAGGSGKGAVI